MAAITINVPDAVLARVVDGMAVTHGWTPADGAKAAFAKRALIQYIKANVRAAEQADAEAAAPRPTVPEVEGIT